MHPRSLMWLDIWWWWCDNPTGGSKGQRCAHCWFLPRLQKLNMESGEILVIPSQTHRQADHQNYKISARRDLDISCVNAAILLEEHDGKVQDIRLAYGGIGPVVNVSDRQSLHCSVKQWVKKNFCSQNWSRPRLHRFLMFGVQHVLDIRCRAIYWAIFCRNPKHAGAVMIHKQSKGPVAKRKGSPHDSAVTHVAGKSTFIDDRAPVRNELHVGLVYAEAASGVLNAIDTDAAMMVEGVAGIIPMQIWRTIFGVPSFMISRCS